MKKFTFFVTVLLIFLLTACSTSVPATAQSPTLTSANTEAVRSTVSQSPSQSVQEVSFSKDILPIFQQYSDSHHSSQSVLSLETYEGVMQDVVSGQPEQSKLYQRLIGQGGPVMPPGNPLPENLINLIYNWIKQGAKNN
jgi:hypothetical protein